MRDSEERYRTLFEGSAEGILVADIETKQFKYANPAICRILGYTEEELKRMSVVDIHPKDALEHVISEFEAQAREEKTLAPNISCLRKNGTTIYADINTAKILIDEKECNIGFFTDITERKRAEEKIKEQNEFLNNIIESVAYPFYVINANDYRIELANSAACLGSLSKNSTCYSFTHESSKPCESTEHSCPLDEVKKTKKPVIVEHIHYDKDGNLRNVEVHGHPIFDNDGNVVQMIEYCLDITERKRAEEEIRKKNKELESFVYMVSHDLKNPVVSIQGFCSSILKNQREELNEKTLFYLERVQANASLMSSLLEDLVELSRIGKITDTKREISVQEVVKSVWVGISRSLPTEDVEFIVPENLPRIFYSDKRLYQIFYNLLSNAVKFKSENKTSKVEIGYQEDKDNYTFFVQDNGIGIDKKYHNKIFNVFSQLKEAESEGTGIGLATVKKIVDTNQGKVWVQSQKGAGSTFYFTIPKK